MKPSFGDMALGPPGVVTVTSTVPADAAGDVAFNWVADTKVTAAAAVVPKLTVEVLVKFVPVMETFVPPTSGPALGLTAATVGAAM